MKKYLTIIFTFSLLFISSIVSADWYIEKTIENGMAQTIEKIWVKGKFYKIQNDEVSIIVDAEKEVITYELHKSRVYGTCSFSEFKETLSKSQTILFEKMIAVIPIEQRKAAEESYKNYFKNDSSALKVTITPTGKKELIQGYNCAEFEVFNDGVKIETFYHTSEINLFESMSGNVVEKIFSSMETGYSSSGSQHSYVYKKILLNGFIMKTIEVGLPFMPVNSEEVTLVENADIDPTIFLISNGYKPLPMNELLLLELTSEMEMNNDEE